MDIVLEQLTKTYRRGARALDQVDLAIPTGMFGLLGANGAGKTTLMRILAGVLRPTSGLARVGGHDITTSEGRTAVQRALGYLPQHLGLYPDLTGRKFLDYLGLLKGLDSRSARRERVDELLHLVALAHVADRKLATYSGGMQRRIGIAQALLNDPRLLVVDEPTAGLDPEERVRFRALLAHLAGNRTVLLSTHIVDDIAQTCRELAVLAEGRVAFRGTVADLTAVGAGKTWTVRTEGAPPVDASRITAALPEGNGMRYRLVAPTVPSPQAEPVAPTLEDGYLALVRGLTGMASARRQ